MEATPEQRASWPPPNFDNPDSRGALVTGFTAPTMALAIIFTMARFYGKGILRQALWLDDWIMLAATIISIPVSIFPMVSLNFGLGRHIWDLKPEWAEPYAKIGFIADILFPISCSLTKVSLCLTYLRLFPGKADKIFNYTLMIFVTIYTVVCIFLMLFQCTPIRGYWDPSAKQSCINTRVTLVVVAALNSLSDFLIFLWPAKPLWSLHLPMKQRISLIMIFAVGCTVCIAGICRMYYLEQYFDSYDLLWVGAIIWLVMSVEMNLGIICGCLSGVKPVLAVVFPRLFASSYKSNSRPTYPTYGRTTRPGGESFAFQPLTDASTRTKKGEVHIEALNPEDGRHTDQRNYAWAASTAAEDVDDSHVVPPGQIAVNQVVTIREEEREVDGSSPTPLERSTKGDNGSEEWIMEEFPNAPPPARTKN
ncbi:hypothetical protein BU24DRAFT_111794 [Aaosphaeria arxii CBS 175.79]|uniref:Rhodopsin domain-containing protein n=1 Tax=Aaosphaeria arxii CBS 175.79 TaxID=1450172 RepID=A0A6A5Y0R9_9PLEO|nr:uncharacterized protein BU24DRAFT_111794 [Aaosphaeria arxii CBS 175.79]KAF2019062.1 hypothetical protein BU24DRAFT_111794 [Aaosphaeria arxii CBS 175.79]